MKPLISTSYNPGIANIASANHSYFARISYSAKENAGAGIEREREDEPLKDILRCGKRERHEILYFAMDKTTKVEHAKEGMGTKNKGYGK